MGRGFYVNMHVPDLQKALSDLSAYDGKSRLRIENAVSTSTKAIGQGMRRRVPVRSGKLKKRITTSFNSRKVEGIAKARSPYAHLVEFGHKGAVVVPKDKRALNLGGGHFAEKVKLPDVSEHPFARPSFEDEQPNLMRNIKGAVRP